MQRIRGHARALGRFGRLVAWTCWCEATRMAGRKRNGPDALKHWARGACRILRVRVDASGPLPPRGSLVVANHLSYLDIVVIASAVDARFLAKREVGTWPLVGSLATRLGTLFIDRDRVRDLPRAMTAIDGALHAHDRVVVFPEGTTTDGSAVLPFRSGLLQVALDRDRPVYCASLSFPGRTGALCCWLGDATFVPHFYRLLTRPAVEATLRFSERGFFHPNRKELARTLRQAVIEGHLTSRHVRWQPARGPADRRPEFTATAVRV